MTPLGVLFALLVAMAYGLTPILQKLILTDVSVESLMFLVGIPVSIGFLGFVGFNYKKILHDFAAKNVKPRVLGRVVFLGIFCALLPYIIYANLIKRYKSHYIAALIASAPAFTLFFTKAILKEDISLLSAGGVALIVGGVACIVLSSGRTADPIMEK